MVSMESLEAQLKRIDFSIKGWGRTEAKELVNILHEHEEIFDCVNGYYEGGFALLVATNIRLMLVDKKPMNYLTVEEIRFDMINEIDYSHRLVGAHIRVASGNNEPLRFTSLNQQRLRKTIGHVQHQMALLKKNETEDAVDQKSHLSQINQQLQSYLVTQQHQQEALKQQLEAVKEGLKAPEEVKIESIKPSHELSDYLFAQSLLEQAKKEHPDLQVPEANSLATEIIHTAAMAPSAVLPEIMPPSFSERVSTQVNDLYEEGLKEVFGNKHQAETVRNNSLESGELTERGTKYGKLLFFPITGGIEINPYAVACSKLPMMLRNRKLGRGSDGQTRNYEVIPQLTNWQ